MNSRVSFLSAKLPLLLTLLTYIPVGKATAPAHAPYMHDGRALTLGDAILMHGGDAKMVRDAYENLTGQSQARLLKFLLTLRTPCNPVKGLTKKGAK